MVSKPGYFSRQELNNGASEFYREQGYLVVPDALTSDQVDELCRETVAICRGQRAELGAGWLGGNGQRHPDMPTPEEMAKLDDDELLKRFLCIHFPHKCSRVMLEALSHPVIVDVLTRAIGPDVKCMQSMLFVKAAGKPGQAWHQDEDYIPTRDRSLCGAWISLDRATTENGCLWVIPGSHRPGILWPQYPHDDPRFDCSLQSYDFPYTDEDAIPVEVPPGGVVFFNGYLLHRSLPNQATSGFRRALVNHYMSAQSFLPWHVEPNVSIAKTDNRDIVMVAGRDPYAWKGLEDLHKPHVRPSGQGGCGDGRVALDAFKDRPVSEKAKL
ncbi:MAG: phytanoyl-CoA dioxygenase family protein [Phycisphaeraceae bacterium]|nr:phytanoyl-CoA dioxygenase family protein [Phycisphaeraceae bacterium]